MGMPISNLARGGSEPTARLCLAARDFGEGPGISRDGFGDGLAIDEPSLPPASDQPGFAQNSEMVRDGCRSQAAHRYDLAAGYVVACRDVFKDPEAGLVGQGFGYFLDVEKVH